MKLYHYTIADRLVKILMSGHLKLTPSIDNPNLGEDEQRSVWLTSNPNWDKTAFYGYPDNALDNAGRIRITINGENRMPHAQAVSHVLGDWESLIWSAMEVKVNHKEWFVSFVEINLEEFLEVELWKDEKWQTVPVLKKDMK